MSTVVSWNRNFNTHTFPLATTHPHPHPHLPLQAIQTIQLQFLLYSGRLNCKLAHNATKLDSVNRFEPAASSQLPAAVLAAIAKPLGAVRQSVRSSGRPVLQLATPPVSEWAGQQSSEQIGLLLNCLVNGYNDTINCMSVSQLALKSAPNAQLPFATAAANMNSFLCLN